MRLLLLFLVLLFGAGQQAAAQGFQVRPLSVEGEVPAGTTVEIPIEIVPTSAVEGRTLNVEVAQLGQASDGAFRAIAYQPGTELPRSAAPWIEAPAQIQLAPRDATILNLTMQVPSGARGNYAAAIVLSAPPPDDATGLRLTLRILIPIIIGTEGRPSRQDVRMADATLRYRLAEPDNPAEEPAESQPPVSTLVDTLIENNGGTFSRVSGNLWVDAMDESGAWRQVRRAEIAEMRILPETAIELPVDLGRLLPQGDYRLRGELYVDGRRTLPLQREVAFEGHPDVDALVTDIDLRFEPSVFRFDYQEGATRSGIVSIENPGLDPIEIEIGVGLPRDMAGRASADVRGEELSAAEWVSVAPDRFVLRPGQTRNLRLVAQFPEAPPEHQNTYATLSAEAYYADGQRAGSASGLVEVTVAEGTNEPMAELESLRVSSAGSEGEYALSLRATNIGNVLLRPSVEFLLVDEAGAVLRTGRLTSDADDPLLPLATRSFGGTLDIADLPEGEFTLLTLFRDGGVELADMVQTVRKSARGEVEIATPSQ